MDIHDVSNLDEYIQILARRKANLKAAIAHQGERPKDMKPRQELIHTFMMMYMAQITNPPAAFQIHSSFVPPPYPPCITRLEELKQIYIKDLRLENHHRGSYLLVRSLTPPNRMTAIMAIVEDEREDAVMLQLYHQPDKKVRPATNVITKGDIFLIKEPFFKILSDGEYGLRVDHVSDLIGIDAYHDMVPKQWSPRVLDVGKTAGNWKQEGDAAMGRKQYLTAIQSYTVALTCQPPVQEDKTIRLNRALAYLKDGRLDAALTDTNCLTSPSDAPEKALYRAGQALYGLGRFSECFDILAVLCKKYPNNAIATTELARVRSRLAEQNSGTYDFKSIYEKVSKVRPPHLDHATFVGPVAVKPSKDRGRGLFTTEAVKAGELLLCEKAFAHCYADTEDDSGGNSKISLLMNVYTNRMTMGTQSDLITTIVQKLWQNPSLSPEFTALYHGSYEPVNVVEVDGRPVVDTFLVERIIALNAFGCPLSSYKARYTVSKDKSNHHSCGIWIMASTINHSCLSNARRSFIGDLQLVHATCDIPANTELTFWYKVPTGEGCEMQKGLEGWGFQCKCAICLDLEETSKTLLRKRKNFLGDLRATLDASNVDIAKAERLLTSINQTYKHPPTTVPRLALRGPYLKLASVYSTQQMADSSVSMALKALECLGFVIKGAHLPALSGKPFEVAKWGIMMDGVVDAWVHLCNAYTVFAPYLFPQAEDCAKLAYKICIGEEETFRQAMDALYV